MTMTPIQMPTTNWRASDAVLAQSIAADSGWVQDASGAIYDQHGVYIAPSLTVLGRTMRSLGWFIPDSAASTGIHWRNVPDSSTARANAVGPPS